MIKFQNNYKQRAKVKEDYLRRRDTNGTEAALYQLLTL